MGDQLIGLPLFRSDPTLLTRLPPAIEERFHDLLGSYRDPLQDNRRYVFDQFHFRDVVGKVVGVQTIIGWRPRHAVA